ncbi:hypothetical protein [Parablautia muri]|uniref:hypothetical protein n=1 Tax=Parablautia muri TaxID=2320879 RepID=UPI0024128173|nr:hypothetical protein [Parablautia muri]
MKKIIKFILGFVAAVFIIIAVLWGSFVYVSDYKITEADTSVSPDGDHELVLQAVGEADFPFGSASGRLILYEGKSRISKADFELFDDGGCIRSSIWEVTWHEDYVEVILSGDEQIDEQIILYFDGRKAVKQLTDWDRYGEAWAWDVSESGEINPQTAYDPQTTYAGESQDMEIDGNDVNLDDDIDSIEKINEYIIQEQSFDVTLDDWGEVTFVSCSPLAWQSYKETSFFLVRNDQILYKFPCSNLKGFEGLFDSVGAVAFRDINDDGKDDIVIIINYITGAGPQGMIPRPAARIFLAGENEFYIADDMEKDVTEHIPEKEMTIASICNYLKNNNEIMEKNTPF